MQMDREENHSFTCGSSSSVPSKKAKPQSGVLFHFLLTKQKRTSWHQRLRCVHVSGSPHSLVWAWQREPGFSLLFYLYPKLVVENLSSFQESHWTEKEKFEGKGRKDCNRSTKTAEIRQLTSFSYMTCRQTAIES